jgi:hypothetical protein
MSNSNTDNKSLAQWRTIQKPTTTNKTVKHLGKMQPLKQTANSHDTF